MDNNGKVETMLNGIEATASIVKGLETLVLVCNELESPNDGNEKLIAYFSSMKDGFENSIEWMMKSEDK